METYASVYKVEILVPEIECVVLYSEQGFIRLYKLNERIIWDGIEKSVKSVVNLCG